MAKNLPSNAGDLGSIPGSGRLPEGGSCLESSMDRGAWWAVAHGVPKSRTQLSDSHTHTHTHTHTKDRCEFLLQFPNFDSNYLVEDSQRQGVI